MNKMNYTSLSFICLLSIVIISSSYAEVKPVSQTAGEILTQSELSKCQNKTKLLAQTEKHLNERLSQFEAQKNDINQLVIDRAQMYSDVDFHSQASVDKYNRINKQVKKMSQLYIYDTGSYNDTVQQYQADLKHHTIECDDKQYYKK